MQVSTMIAKAGTKLIQNKPKVCFAIGVFGLVGLGISSFKAGKILPGLIDDIAYELGPDGLPTDPKHKLKRVGLEVMPVVLPMSILGTLSIAAFAEGQRELSLRASAALTAYSLSEKAFEDYRNKLIESMGKETHDAIQTAVDNQVPKEIEDKANGCLTDNDVANMMPREVGDLLFYDKETHAFFWSTEEKILDAESAVNKQLIESQIADINDFYSYLGLEPCNIGNVLGWDSTLPPNNRARSLDIRFGGQRNNDVKQAVNIISYYWDVVYKQDIKNH